MVNSNTIFSCLLLYCTCEIMNIIFLIYFLGLYVHNIYFIKLLIPMRIIPRVRFRTLRAYTCTDCPEIFFGDRSMTLLSLCKISRRSAQWLLRKCYRKTVPTLSLRTHYLHYFILAVIPRVRFRSLRAYIFTDCPEIFFWW